MPEAFNAAVRLLARREHSRYQLQNKLKQRGFLMDAIDEALDKCLRLDLQSDVRFADMYCRGRINRGYGPVVIRQLLRQEGVSVDIADDILEQANVDINWLHEAARVWHKKYQNIPDNPSPLEQQKQRNFLRYRGFTEAVIGSFFERLNVNELDNNTV
ncbi:MAG: recombination regulator RecX [Gammaproteobacteria bacterium]|nr:recombination regulator RecX [Gammaproteobacteria bacterium]MCH9717083.1 recombination regulator RecX [Gammaproteobacteria bacterium]